MFGPFQTIENSSTLRMLCIETTVVLGLKNKQKNHPGFASRLEVRGKINRIITLRKIVQL